MISANRFQGEALHGEHIILGSVKYLLNTVSDFVCPICCKEEIKPSLEWNQQELKSLEMMHCRYAEAHYVCWVNWLKAGNHCCFNCNSNSYPNYGQNRCQTWIANRLQEQRKIVTIGQRVGTDLPNDPEYRHIRAEREQNCDRYPAKAHEALQQAWIKNNHVVTLGEVWRIRDMEALWEETEQRAQRGQT